MTRPLYFAGMAVLFGLIGIVIYEIYAALTGNVETISVFAEHLDSVNPLASHSVTMIMGLLVGHWFIPPSCKRCKK